MQIDFHLILTKTARYAVSDFASDIAERLELAVDAAYEAGKRTLQYFQGRAYTIQRKSDNSPVTDADREAEIFLRDRIIASFPDDQIIGEEFPDRDGDSLFRWIVDPIDGTKSFISGVPLYGTLIGIQFEGKGVAGVIEMPALDERVFASQGQGAWHVQGRQPRRQARVCDCAQLSDGLLLTSEFAGWQDREILDILQELQQASWFTRTWGDCFGYLLVATGRAVAMIDPVLNIWDAAAVQPVLEEAGGTFTDWSGQPTVAHGEGIGTNGHVLTEVLNITKRAAPRVVAPE